jgi:hypothetical membrane protein
MTRLTHTEYAGALLFSGGTVLFLAMMVAEALYPGYSIADNYISDLGVGSTAPVFNTAIVIYGACIIAAAYLLRRDGMVPMPTPALFVLGLSGAGAACVGIFPETLGAPHVISAGVAFVGGAVAALVLSRSVSVPFRWFSALMGCIALAGLVLHLSHTYIGIGPGGTERLVAYPLMLWSAGLGGYLMAQAGGGRKGG